MDNDSLLVVLEGRLMRIDAQIQKLRKAVQDGVYDPREIVGDVTLSLEGELRHIKKLLEENKTPRS